MPKRVKYTKEQLEEAIKDSRSMRSAAHKLGLNLNGGGSLQALNKKIKEWNISTSHMTGQAWNKGGRGTRVPWSLEKILKKDSHYHSNSLKKRLIKEGYFAKECSWCKLTQWQDKEIPLELDHINGIKSDNRIENLRILCANCHSQTDTYRRKKY